MRKTFIPILCLLAFVLAGCGSSRDEFVFTGTQPGAQNSTLQINHQILNRALPANSQMRVTLLEGTVIAFRSNTTPVQPQVSFTIPLQGNFTLGIEYFDTNGQIFGVFSQEISLVFGQTLVIDDPAWIDAEDAVTALTVTPASISIAVGSSTQLTATATFANGTSANVSNIAEWSSNNAAATVNDTGSVTGASLGTATITAEFGGRTATSSVTVVSVPPPGNITSLTVDPDTANITKIAPGNTTQLNALAGFDGGPTDQNVNDQVTWTVDPANAGVTVVDGLVTSDDADLGDYTVTATFPDSEFSESAVVTVVTAVTGFEVDPTEATIGDNAPGNTVQLNALAGFDGGANDQNVNDQAEWSVTPEDQGVTVVDGLVTAVDADPGDYTITAAFSGFDASATVTVQGSLSLDGAGVFTLRTTDGMLSPLDGNPDDGAEIEGWNSGDNELQVHNFELTNGTTLRVIGDNPFVARLSGNASINGVINASGGNGGNGTGVALNATAAGGTGGSAGAGGGAGGNGGDNSNNPTSASGADGVSVGLNGGGTGGISDGTTNQRVAGGGGGGHSAAGTAGAASNGGTAGSGGDAYDSINADPPALLGGSGGGGGSHRRSTGGSGSERGGGGGGGGGGVVAILSQASVLLTGDIQANGGAGGAGGGNSSAGGGGGAGGAILIVSENANDVPSGSLSAVGGTGNTAETNGGNGAAGRILIQDLEGATAFESP